MMYSPYGPKRARQTEPVDIVSTLQDDHPALSRNLLRELQAERAKHYESLISAKDWADFEKRRGLIHGIEAAIALCEKSKAALEA
jgi:flagellar motor switch protein FliG